MAVEELREKVAYLQGLATGLGLDKNTKEGQILNEIIGVLGKMAQEISDLKEAQEDLEEYLESIDEDLYELEDEVYDTGEEEAEEGEEDYMEVECPECRETVCFSSELLDEEGVVEVTCPKCGTVVFTTEMEDVEEEPERLAGEKAAEKAEG